MLLHSSIHGTVTGDMFGREALAAERLGVAARATQHLGSVQEGAVARREVPAPQAPAG